MLNGDSITGASDVKSVTIETEWGSAKINGQNISSMMFVPGLEWQSINGLNGARWTLTEAKAKPTNPAPGSSNQPQSSVSAGNAGNGSFPSNGNGNGLLPAGNNAPRVVFPR